MTLSALAKPVPQRGFSLVGIMVGMLLSMISILTALVLYRTMVHTSVGSRINATIDGQMASAMSILQMELQSAGFGYPANGLSLFVPGGTNPAYFYWRYLDGTTNVCRGFKVVNPDATTRQLELVAPTTCDATTPLASLTWSNTLTQLAEFRVLNAAAGTTPVLPKVTISVATVACFPYGMTPKAQYPQITISIDNAARRAALEANASATPSINAFTYSFCLSNIGSTSL